MYSSPLPLLKSTKESEDPAPIVETLTDETDVPRPILSKDETLCENNLLQAVNEAQQPRKSLDLIETKKHDSFPRSSTIGSRRLDSIRFKEGARLDNFKYHSLPRGSSIPVTLKEKAIEAEIDDIFQKVF